MIVLIKTLQVILALSVLIIVHEFGHFLFARIFGVKVDKFYLFFDVGGARLFSTKHSRLLNRLFPKLKDCDTDFGIGVLPFGGYCKIAGMIDESLDTEQLSGAPQPWEFRSKKPWQRLLIMFGGVLFNFILAIFIYVCILAGWGEAYICNEGNSIYVNELAYDMGFRNGDHIISFDDYEPDNFGMLQAELARRETLCAKVLRNGDTVSIYIDNSRLSEVLSTPGMFDLAVPFVIDSIPPTSPNAGSGLVRDDRIVSLEGQPVSFVQDSRPILAGRAGRLAVASVVRGDDTVAMQLNVDTTGRIGVFTKMPPYRTREYNFLQAVPAGFRLTFSTIGGYLRDIRLVFTPSTGAYKSVGSFIAIGSVFPSVWDWYTFLNLLALLSIMLGVMNLIPIPGLDGGHILFTLYEMVTGRKPGDKFLVVAQLVGMALLLMLMFLAFGNDIGRLLK